MIEKGSMPEEIAFELAERMSYSAPKDFFAL